MARKRTVIVKAGKSRIPVEKSCGNVFRDLGLPDAEELKVKADLTWQIAQRLQQLKLTQVRAAAQLGIKQPDVSKLMNGAFTGFSTDRLLSLLTALKCDIEIVLKPSQGRSARGEIKVLPVAA